VIALWVSWREFIIIFLAAFAALAVYNLIRR
jgi:hypothetical protein